MPIIAVVLVIYLIEAARAMRDGHNAPTEEAFDDALTELEAIE